MKVLRTNILPSHRLGAHTYGHGLRRLAGGIYGSVILSLHKCIVPLVLTRILWVKMAVIIHNLQMRKPSLGEIKDQRSLNSSQSEPGFELRQCCLAPMSLKSILLHLQTCKLFLNTTVNNAALNTLMGEVIFAFWFAFMRKNVNLAVTRLKHWCKYIVSDITFALAAGHRRAGPTPPRTQ